MIKNSMVIMTFICAMSCCTTLGVDNSVTIHNYRIRRLKSLDRDNEHTKLCKLDANEMTRYYNRLISYHLIIWLSINRE